MYIQTGTTFLTPKDILNTLVRYPQSNKILLRWIRGMVFNSSSGMYHGILLESNRCLFMFEETTLRCL